MIALGLVENHVQVEKIVGLADCNGNKRLEFNEFLSILKSDLAAQRNQKVKGAGAIHSFFNKLTANKFTKSNENMPFSLFVSQYRRQKILDSIMSKQPENKAKGEKMIENYKKNVAYRMAKESLEELSNEESEYQSKA